MQPSAEALAEVTERFIDAFTERKQDKNLVDFSDLEHFALEILVEEETGKPTETAKEFQNAYEEIMIDEYQDSNYVQETILRTISREVVGQNNLFMVGDVNRVFTVFVWRDQSFLWKSLILMRQQMHPASGLICIRTSEAEIRCLLLPMIFSIGL